MPGLLVIRHAKSDWNAGADDHDRPLNERGRRAAGRQGRALDELGLRPAALWSSTARRAAETAERIASGAGWHDLAIRELDELYVQDATGVVEALRGHADDVGLAAVVGHEPWTSDLIALVVGGRVRMVTGTAALIEWAGTWTDLGRCVGELRLLLPPRVRLRSGDPGD